MHPKSRDPPSGRRHITIGGKNNRHSLIACILLGLMALTPFSLSLYASCRLGQLHPLLQVLPAFKQIELHGVLDALSGFMDEVCIYPMDSGLQSLHHGTYMSVCVRARVPPSSSSASSSRRRTDHSCRLSRCRLHLLPHLPVHHSLVQVKLWSRESDSKLFQSRPNVQPHEIRSVEQAE